MLLEPGMKSGPEWARLRILVLRLRARPAGLPANASAIPLTDRACHEPAPRPCLQDCCAPIRQFAENGLRVRRTSESPRPERGRERRSVEREWKVDPLWKSSSKRQKL